MTEQEVQEYNRLCDEYDRLIVKNRELAEQIDYAVTNVGIITGNMAVVERAVVSDVSYVAKKVNVVDQDVSTLLKAIEDLTSQYFLFKNLSTASKNLTQYNDEYYTKFKFYNELRRITLGYVIGLDSYIISNESLRKKVEKCYLSNTDYWLAYAIMSVMLWASDEKSAAERALKKALTMDCRKSAVFYMLINLRFGRKDTASNWYVYYLDKTDVNNLGDEWQKLLQAYLSGAMGSDPKLEKVAAEYYEKIFVQTESINANFIPSVQTRAFSFMDSFLHTTEKEFVALKNYCKDYPEMQSTLSNLEKFAVVAGYYDEVFNKEEDKAENDDERIENVLYDLINSYDEKEAVIVRKIKYNEAIMGAKGDIAIAQKKYNEQYANIKDKKNAGDMLIKWAFSEDYVETDVTVKKFSISYLSNYIVNGFKNYAEKVKKSVRDNFNVNIDGCSLNCNDGNLEECKQTLQDYYYKNRMKTTFKDKSFMIYVLICVVSVILIAFAGLLVHTQAFSVLLTLGIVVGIFGGFMVWRRYVDVGKIIKENCRKSLLALNDVFEEILSWKKIVDEESANEEDLYNSVLKFKQ